MYRSKLTRTYARALGVCAIAVLVGTATACASEEPTGEPGPGSAPGGSSADVDAAGFCGNIDGIEEDLALLELTEIADPVQFPDQVSRAAERFATVEPPEQIATSWQHVGDVLALTDEALRDVEVTSEADLQQALSFESEEAFAMMVTLPGQMETVGVYIQDSCQVDLGITPPAVADVCAAIDPAELGSVFGDDVPEGENRPWGEGTVECVWDDGNDREVGIVVLPAEAMHSDLLDGLSPTESVQVDRAIVDVYDGAVGPLRASAGRTASTVVGETGVLVSVSSGDAQAEAQTAVALAGLVAGNLG